MPAEQIVVVRHGRTESNAIGRWQGQLDVPLDDEGRRQSETAAAVLVPTFTDVVKLVTSDLSRAVETARPLAAGWGLEAETDTDLREVYAGKWEGLSQDEVRAQWPDDLARWRNGEDIYMGGGERISHAGARVAAAIAAHAETLDGGTLVAVGHGAGLRVGVPFLLGLEFGQLSLIGLHNTRWGVLVPGNTHRWRLEAWNLSADPPPEGPTGETGEKRFLPNGEGAL